MQFNQIVPKLRNPLNWRCKTKCSCFCVDIIFWVDLTLWLFSEAHKIFIHFFLSTLMIYAFYVRHVFFRSGSALLSIISIYYPYNYCIKLLDRQDESLRFFYQNSLYFLNFLRFLCFYFLRTKKNTCFTINRESWTWQKVKNIQEIHS